MRFNLAGADRNTGADVKVVINAGTANEAEAIAREKGILVESVVPMAGQRGWFTKRPVIVAAIVIGGLCALTAGLALTGETRSQSAKRSDSAQLAVHAPSDFCANLLRTEPTLDCKHVDGILAIANGLIARGYTHPSGEPVDVGRLSLMIFSPNHFQKTHQHGFEIEWRVQAMTGKSSFMSVQDNLAEHSYKLTKATREIWASAFVHNISAELSAAGLETLSEASRQMLDAIEGNAPPNKYGWQRQYAATQSVGGYVMKTTIQSVAESDKWETEAWSRVVLEFEFDPKRKIESTDDADRTTSLRNPSDDRRRD